MLRQNCFLNVEYFITLVGKFFKGEIIMYSYIMTALAYSIAVFSAIMMALTWDTQQAIIWLIAFVGWCQVATAEKL